MNKVYYDDVNRHLGERNPYTVRGKQQTRRMPDAIKYIRAVYTYICRMLSRLPYGYLDLTVLIVVLHLMYVYIFILYKYFVSDDSNRLRTYSS